MLFWGGGSFEVLTMSFKTENTLNPNKLGKVLNFLKVSNSLHVFFVSGYYVPVVKAVDFNIAIIVKLFNMCYLLVVIISP